MKKPMYEFEDIIFHRLNLEEQGVVASVQYFTPDFYFYNILWRNGEVTPHTETELLDKESRDVLKLTGENE